MNFSVDDRDERQARSMLELDSTGSHQFLGFGLPGVDNEHEWLSLVSGRVLIKPGRIPSWLASKRRFVAEVHPDGCTTAMEEDTPG